MLEPIEIQNEIEVEKALSAICAYKQERYDREIRSETLPKLLYDLFENIWFSEKTYQYTDNVVTLLSFLLKPKVVDIIKEELSPSMQDDITRMLLGIYDFFRSLNNEYYQLQLEMVEVEHCTDANKLRSIKTKYDAKLKGWLKEQMIKQESYS